MAKRRWHLSVIRVRQVVDHLQHRLSFIPILYVVGALIFVQGVLWLDRNVTTSGALPDLLQTTVESARSVFSAMAGGLITSITLLLSMLLITVQLASAQFSPRTLRDWLGNRTLQHAIGLVLGTTVFCLLALRSTRDFGENGGAVIPHITVLVAVALGVISLIAVVRSVDHITHSVQVASVARRVSAETVRVLERVGAENDGRALDIVVPSGAIGPDGEIDPPSGAVGIEAATTGWVQQMDIGALFDALPASTSAYVIAPVGQFVVSGTPLVWLAPAPGDERTLQAVHDAFAIGESRTMQQDVEFGIVQLTDIAVRALSPGINDPSTACEVIVYLGAVLLRIWEMAPMPTTLRHDDRTIVRSVASPGAVLARALTPILRYGRDDQEVTGQLRTTVGLIRSETVRRDLPGPLEPLDDFLDRIQRASTDDV